MLMKVKKYKNITVQTDEGTNPGWDTPMEEMCGNIYDFTTSTWVGAKGYKCYEAKDNRYTWREDWLCGPNEDL